MIIREIQQKIMNYISKYELLHQGDTIVVGVSGGADSIMLLDFLNSQKDYYGIHLKVAHVHHGIRKEADEEQRYVETLCQQLDLPCYTHHCNIKDIARTDKVSEEEAGRQERYNFFISLSNGCDKIATAHTVNDQAETMLMRFFRGSDIRGLGGILPKRDQIIRPILCLTREEVEKYCELRALKYYQDQTNFETYYTRNKIRLECLPYIKQAFNPNIITTLASHSTLYQEEEEFLSEYVDRLYEKCVTYNGEELKISKSYLQQEKVYMQKKLLLKCIGMMAKSTKDIAMIHINQCIELADRQTGKAIHLPYGLIVTRQYEHLVLKKSEEVIFTNYEYRLQLGINRVESFNLEVECTLKDRKTFEQSKENMYTKYIDYDKIKDNLRIRSRKTGDTIMLANGSKKLKKLLIDEKIPQELRQQIPLVVDHEQIIWIVGSRLSSKYFVTKDTRNILEIKILNKNTQEGLC